MTEPATLTEAHNKGMAYLITRRVERTSSNTRIIPYAERYAAASGVIETPIQHLDAAAKDEAERSRKRRQ